MVTDKYAPVPAAPSEMVTRYYRTVDADNDIYDIVFMDRLTGKEVMRYDGVDPANRPPLGPSDEECFIRKGLDREEEIRAEQSLLPVSQIDVQLLASRKQRLSREAAENARGLAFVEALPEKSLLHYLGITEFDPDAYREFERNVLVPALSLKGFHDIGFYMIEEDSFGPLVRGIVCTYITDRQVYRFSYY